MVKKNRYIGKHGRPLFDRKEIGRFELVGLNIGRQFGGMRELFDAHAGFGAITESGQKYRAYGKTIDKLLQKKR